MSPAFVAALIIFALAIAGILAGLSLSSVQALSRRLIAFSGGVLAGVSGFWILPELAGVFGWTAAVGWLTAGFATLWAIDKYVYTVCPSCSHTHDHDGCKTRLHGFAGPMLVVAGMHSFLDGWIVAASGAGSTAVLASAVLVGVAVHKIPEGMALGVIVQASVKRHVSALWSCIVAESMTVAGAGAAIRLAPSLGTDWAHYVVALAAGSFLFLGYHAVHSEYKRGGAVPALMPALTGVAGSSVIRLVGVRFFGV